MRRTNNFNAQKKIACQHCATAIAKRQRPLLPELGCKLDLRLSKSANIGFFVEWHAVANACTIVKEKEKEDEE